MIIEARHPEGIPLRLSEDNALTAVLAELDAQEYPTRMGVSVEVPGRCGTCWMA
jgi:hypothetical protein